MVVTTPPICATSCVNSAADESPCYYDYGNAYTSCLCLDQTYLAEAKACLQSLCDATDQQLWLDYAVEQCDSVGVSLPFSTASIAQEPTSTATGALVVTTTSLSGLSTTPTSASQSTASSSSNSGAGSGGLSVGDIVGITTAVIAAIGLVLTALGLCFPNQRKEITDALRNFGNAQNTTRSNRAYQSLSPDGYIQQSVPIVR